MKTLAEIAQECGKPRQYAYDAVKKAGLSLKEITVEKQGNKRLISEEAEQTVRKILLEENDSDCNQTVKDSTVNDSITVDETVNKQLSELSLQNDSLKKQLDKLKDELEKERAAKAEQERIGEDLKGKLEIAEKTIDEQKATLIKREADLDETRHQVSFLSKHVNDLQEHLDQANAKLLAPPEEPKKQKVGFFRRLFGKD